MKIANVKGLVTKSLMVALAAGTLMFAGAAKAQAQQFGVGVQFGHPAYAYDRDYRRHEEFREREAREFRERQAREEFARRQAFLRHEEWERHHRYDRFDRPYGYR